MSTRIHFRFDATRVEPILRELASIDQPASRDRRAKNAPDPVEAALRRGLSSWPGVVLTRVWVPGRPQIPLELKQVSQSGTPLHIPNHLPAQSWIHETGARGLGAHPLGTQPPFGILLVLTRMPLESEAFWWLGRLADHATLAWNRMQPGAADSGDRDIYSQAEFKDFERLNLTRALEKTSGKIFGTSGAAAVLGMKPTTLASRIKALGIDRLPRLNHE